MKKNIQIISDKNQKSLRIKSIEVGLCKWENQAKKDIYIYEFYRHG